MSNRLVDEAVGIATLVAKSALDAQNDDKSFEFMVAIAKDAMEILEDLPAPLGDCYERAVQVVIDHMSE